MRVLSCFSVFCFSVFGSCFLEACSFLTGDGGRVDPAWVSGGGTAADKSEKSENKQTKKENISTFGHLA